MPTDLSSEQLDGLRALKIAEPADPEKYTSTVDFARALYELQGATPGPRFLPLSRPWSGNRELLMSLEAEGLLEVHMNVAKFRAFDDPISRGDEEDYFLSFTEQGRAALEKSNAAD